MSERAMGGSGFQGRSAGDDSEPDEYGNVVEARAVGNGKGDAGEIAARDREVQEELSATNRHLVQKDMNSSDEVIRNRFVIKPGDVIPEPGTRERQKFLEGYVQKEMVERDTDYTVHRPGMVAGAFRAMGVSDNLNPALGEQDRRIMEVERRSVMLMRMSDEELIGHFGESLRGDRPPPIRTASRIDWIKERVSREMEREETIRRSGSDLVAEAHEREDRHQELMEKHRGGAPDEARRQGRPDQGKPVNGQTAQEPWSPSFRQPASMQAQDDERDQQLGRNLEHASDRLVNTRFRNLEGFDAGNQPQGMNRVQFLAGASRDERMQGFMDRHVDRRAPRVAGGPGDILTVEAAERRRTHDMLKFSGKTRGHGRDLPDAMDPANRLGDEKQRAGRAAQLAAFSQQMRQGR